MIRKLLLLLCLLPCAFPGLAASDSNSLADGEKSYEEFRATIKSFPYSASTERKNRLLKNYPRLRVGMTKEQVATLLGSPDYNALVCPKIVGQGDCQGSSWSYYFFKRDESTNLNDPMIDIFFGTDGLLSRAIPQGINGLSEIK